MKKIFIFLLISAISANECSLDNMDDLLKTNQSNFKIVDKTFLLKSENEEQLDFFYVKNNNELRLVRYRGFASTHSLEINYYFGENNNLLVQLTKINYTDFVTSKTMNIFSKQIIEFPLCSGKDFNALNYNGLKKEYELALRIRKLGNF